MCKCCPMFLIRIAIRLCYAELNGLRECRELADVFRPEVINNEIQYRFMCSNLKRGQ